LAGPEFSRLVELDRLRDQDSLHQISADARERHALALRFGLVALDQLSAEIVLRRVRGGAAVRLHGRLTALATQSCVVTLEPVATRVEEKFTLLFAEEARPTAAEVIVGLDDDSAPEPLPETALDIGEIAAQQLALALPAYPRAAGASLERAWPDSAARDASAAKAFAALARLKERRGPGKA
jgi:uncharacterized metal-binding protein YceD (DUF177 family)